MIDNGNLFLFQGHSKEGLLVEPTLLFRVCFDHFIDVVVANRIFYE